MDEANTGHGMLDIASQTGDALWLLTFLYSHLRKSVNKAQ